MQDIEITIIEEDDLPFEAPSLQGRRFVLWGNPEETDVRLLCTQKVIEATEKHARQDQREVGGILLGKASRQQGAIYVEITEYIAAPNNVQQTGGQAQSSRVHFSFTPEIWAEMLRIKDRDYDDLKVVGWFHSHPGHGIFLSEGMDTQIQAEFFQQPWQVAMVYDPIRHEGGFFTWQNSQIISAPGFYELFDSGRRKSIVTWTNLRQPVNKLKERRLQHAVPVLIAVAFIAMLLLYGSLKSELENINKMLHVSIEENNQQLVVLRTTMVAETGMLATELGVNSNKINAAATGLADSVQSQEIQGAIISTIQVQSNQRFDMLNDNLQAQDDKLATILAANELLVASIEDLKVSLIEVNRVQATQEAVLDTIRAQLITPTATPSFTTTPTVTSTTTQETVVVTPVVTFSPTPAISIESSINPTSLTNRLDNKPAGRTPPALIFIGFALLVLVMSIVFIKGDLSLM